MRAPIAPDTLVPGRVKTYPSTVVGVPATVAYFYAEETR